MTDAPATPWQDVPAGLAPALRPGIPGAVDAIVAAVRAEVPEYDLPLEGEFGRLISGGVRGALHEFLSLLGTDAEHPSTALSEELGRGELEAGRTLDALQSAYRVGARVAWRYVVAQGGDQLPPQVMYRLAEAIFAYIDRLADASVAGYADALAAREGSTLARRQALVELLVRGPDDEEQLAAAAHAADWRLPRTLALVACAREDPAQLARAAPDGTLGATADDRGWLVVPDPGGPGRHRRLQDALDGVAAAVGPAVVPAEAGRSAARALRAAELQRAGALPGDRAVHADAHRVALLLAADPDLAHELRAARLAPLDALTPLARARAVETLRAWLDAHGDVSRAAEVLHVHAQTVRYRLGTLREHLGDAALDDPDARLELALALRLPQHVPADGDRPVVG